MSYLYSQALVAAYLADTCSDGAPFAPSSGSPTPQAYCAPDKMTAFSRPSRFGMTFAPLTDDHGAALLTWYQAGFPARTSAPPAKVRASTASDPACGTKWRELSVKYDPATSSWKTHRCLWDEDLPESSLTLPKWGSMRDGVLSERMTSALPTAETDAGLWATPSATDGTRGGTITENTTDVSLAQMVNTPTRWPTQMGYPEEYEIRKVPTRRGDQMRLETTEEYWSRQPAPKKTVLWPTPLATDGSSGGPNQRGGKGDLRLSSAVHHWPTPKTNDAEKRGNFDVMNPRNGLPAAVKNWPTPVATMSKGSSPAALTRKSGADRSGDRLDHAVMASGGGQLNPNFVEWLMGWIYDYTSINKRWTPFSREEITGECLRLVWNDQRFTSTSQGQGFIEQLTREHPDLVCELSHGLALGRGQGSVESLSTVLRGLWQACHSWPLRNAQDSFQTAWECASSETQGWVALASIRGIWHAEWPGVSRVETGVKARVDRLKAIGNGQVPQCAAAAWRILVED